MALLEMMTLTPKYSISLHHSGQRYALPTPTSPPRLPGTLKGSGLQYPSSTMHNRKHAQPREEKTPACLPGLSMWASHSSPAATGEAAVTSAVQR